MRKKEQNLSIILFLFALMCTALFTVVDDVNAYERYYDGCQNCHGAFTGGTSPKGSNPGNNNKMDMHTSGDFMANDCDLCHSSGPKSNPFLAASRGTSENPGQGCNGCHGREEDAGHDSLPGGRGAGLRQHHWYRNVIIDTPIGPVSTRSCVDCHSDTDPANYTPVGEHVTPPYYGTGDTNVDGPCNSVAQHNINENWTLEDFIGLDNDGDGLYDLNDPDCGGLPLCQDSDNDGYVDCNGTCAPGHLICGDCNDSVGSLNPGVPDLCDSLDNDCDGTVDEDCIVNYETDIQPIWDVNCISCHGPVNPKADLDLTTGGSCGNLHVGGFIVPGDSASSLLYQELNTGSMNNKISQINKDMVAMWIDQGSSCGGQGTCTDNDFDGYGNPGDPSCANGAAEDCNDSDYNINPGASEGPVGNVTCNDTVDNDCDGAVDEDCIVNYETYIQPIWDNDCISCHGPVTPEANLDLTPGVSCGNLQNSGFIVPGDSASSLLYQKLFTGSMNQKISQVNKDMVASWIDQGAICGGPGTCTDNDGDGYGNPGDLSCANGAAQDCNDSDPDIYPGAPEGPAGNVTCNDTFDNDCDGYTDSADVECTFVNYETDIQPVWDNDCISCHGPGKIKADLDLTTGGSCGNLHNGGFIVPGDSASSLLYQKLITGSMNQKISPANKDMVASWIDQGAICGGPTCTDNDFDGYGNPGDPSCANGAEEDCNDSDPNIYPGAPEGPVGDVTCTDTVDNDCDGAVDEDCIADYVTDIQPVWNANCINCHGPGKIKADLDLSPGVSCGNLHSGGFIVPGDSASSLLYQELNTGSMNNKISQVNKNTVTAWIDQGAICGGVTCGDGVVEGNEDCDDGAANGTTTCGCQTDCTYTPDLTPCDDGLFCNEGETCDGAGACQGGIANLCDDGVGCTDDSCDEVNDQCVNTANDANCPDDGQYCNGTEFCDAVNDCQSGLHPCDPQTEICDEQVDVCIPITDCGDGNIDPGEDCDDGAANGTTTCGCQTDCTYTAPGTACEDGEFCTSGDTCNGSGMCMSGGPTDCSDGVGCTDDSCDEVNDQCVNNPNDANCPDDGQFCTGTEFCDAGLDCQSTGNPCLPGEACTEPDICEAPALDVPPAVRQNIGFPDRATGDLIEDDCRFCHEDPNIVNGANIPDRHHLLTLQPDNIPPGSLIFVGTCSVTGDFCRSDAECPAGEMCDIPFAPVVPDTDMDGNPDTTYACLSCHPDDPGTPDVDFTVTRDCILCHSAFSPHHMTAEAQAQNCDACHGPVDNPFDGHPVGQNPPSSVTPNRCCGDGLPVHFKEDSSPVFTGGCDYCHETGLTSGDAANGIVDARTSEQLHHDTGLFDQEPAVCDWCHQIVPPDIDNPDPYDIRTCERCHGISSLHNILVDSDATGLVDTTGDGIGDTENLGNIIPNFENTYWGHVGNSDDCWGCHGYGAASNPSTGPIIPHIYLLSAYSVTEGSDFTLTITGSALMNTVYSGGGPEVINSEAVLIADDGTETTLATLAISETSMDVTVPGTLSPGRYVLRAVKDTSDSNAMGFTVVPAVTLTDVSCEKKKGILTINGSGFTEKPGGTDADLNVQINGAVVGIADLISWSDSQIKVSVDRCSNRDSVTVNAVFGSASNGKPCKGKKCR